MTKRNWPSSLSCQCPNISVFSNRRSYLVCVSIYWTLSSSCLVEVQEFLIGDVCLKRNMVVLVSSRKLGALWDLFGEVFFSTSFLSTKRVGFSAVKLNLHQGWRQVFSDRGAESSDEGAKVRLSGSVNAKNLRQNSFSPSDGGLACSNRGAIAPSSPPLVPPLISAKQKNVVLRK